MAKPLEDQTQAELIAYIKELREEAAGHRKASALYDAAFERLTEPEQRGLLHIIEVYGEDQQSGADLFRQLAESILDTGTTTPKEDVMTEQNTTPPAVPATLGSDAPPAWAQALISRLEALDAKVEAQTVAAENDYRQRLITQATAMGFKPGTPEAQELFRIAANMTDGDLEEAKGWYEAKHGPVGGAPAGAEGSAQEAAAQLAAGSPAAGATFPPVASGSGAAPSAVKGEAPDLSKAGVRNAALEYINALGTKPGTPS